MRTFVIPALLGLALLAVGADAQKWKEKKYQPKCQDTRAFDATALGIADVKTYPFNESYTCVKHENNNTDICWQLEADVDTGDTAWMLCATTFVMLQTPAAGFAQGGMVRRKNAMSVIGQAFMGVVIGCIMWYVIGYSLTFGKSCDYKGCNGDLDNNGEALEVSGFIGSIEHHAFFKDVFSHDCAGGTIPHTLFATFQMTFALMVPVLVTGAWAEKFRFSSACLFMVIWPVLVYYPTAHWIWGYGFMSGWGEMGVLDYAGGIVIHTSSGVSAFVVAKMLQKRKAFRNVPDTTHNLPLSMVGVALVWVGWYSFNGGSGLRANGQAAGALLVTQISSCFAAATWALMSYRDDGKIQITHIASGALCGLAGITPGSGHVMPVAGVPIGILVGLSGWYGAYIVKSMVRLDDVLDVTSLQAFPGAIGSILVGFFATTDAYPCETPVFKGKACNRGTNEGMGVFYGGDGTLLGYQILAVLIMIAWAAFFTWVTMKIIQQLTGLDISADEEKLGLDLSHHGEKAYDQDVENDESDDRIKVAELIGFAKAGDVEGCRKVITKMGLHPSKGDVDGRTGLHLAARFGQLATVKLMIEEYNVDVDIKDNKGKTPLQDAQEGMHQEVIGYLKNKNAHQAFSSSDVTKMLGAAASGNLPVLNQFLISNMDPNSHDYDDRTALHLAAASGHENSVKLLLNNGADAAKQDRWGGLALHDSKRKQHQGITAILSDAASGQASVKYKVDMSAVTVRSNQIANSVTTQSTIEVLAAALEGNVDELKRLKKKGANLLEGDYDGRTALHQACVGGHLVVVQFLAGEKKANINVQDNDRHTPLSDAVNNGHADVVTFLKSSGATMNTSEGELCNLANSGNIAELERKITAGGIDANTADYDGRTAMHLAAANGNLKMMRMLVERNANVDVQDRFGGSPLDDAIRANKIDAANLLRQLGANVQSQVQVNETENKLTKTTPV